MSDNDPPRYCRENWRVTIDGIEAYEPYVTQLHRYVYNQVFLGDMCHLIRTVPEYDIVFLGDVIDLVEKPAGYKLLADCLGRARKAVILSTPSPFCKWEWDQDAVCGNPREVHRTTWGRDDLKAFHGAHTLEISGILLGVIVKAGIEVPRCLREAERSTLGKLWSKARRRFRVLLARRQVR
jgi:hypothetical protein